MSRIDSTADIRTRSDKEAEPPISLPPSPTVPRGLRTTGRGETHEGIHALAPDPFR